MNKIRLLRLISILLLIGIIFESNGQSSRLVLPESDSHYYVERWTTDQGLPSNTLLYALQSANGYIWISSFDGIVKFDGLIFDIFNKTNNNTITNAISKIAEDANHNLWIATYGEGLMLYNQGTIKPVNDELINRQSIQTIYIDRKNWVWVGTRGNGLFHFNPKDKVFKKFTHPSLENITVSAIVEGSDGALWFGTEGNGLLKYAKNQFYVYTSENGLPSDKIFSLFFDHSKTLWVGTNSGLSNFTGDEFKTIESVNECLISTLFEDHENNLWVPTDCGLFRLSEETQKWLRLPLDKIIPSDHFTDGFVDSNQNLWFTTYHAGLIQLKKSKFINYTIQDGLASKAISSIALYGDEKYLIGTNNGVVNVIDQGKVSRLKFNTNIPDTRIRGILYDSKGNLWVGTSAGMLLKKKSGEEKWYTTANGLPDNEVRLFYEDRNQNIWFGTRSGGLVKVINEDEFRVIDKSSKLNSNFIMSIQEDLNNNLIVGTNESGLNILKTNGSVEYISEVDGLASDLIFNTYTDENNITWVATNGGISRIEGDNITNITAEHGLNTDAPFDFVEDNNDGVWLPTSKGIIKASKKELNQFASGQIKHISVRLYDKQDGLELSETTGAAKSILADNGNIWVPALNGVIVIDPKKMGFNYTPPSSFITSISVDNKTWYINNQDTIHLDPNFARIVIKYEALNFTSPSKVGYRFMLNNFDKNWIDGGKEREVHYTNLKHGTYNFKIKACNEDNICNKEAAMVTIIVDPHFYETGLFYLLVAIGVTMIVLGAFRISVNNVRKRNKILSALVNEQTSELMEINSALEEQKEELNSQHELLSEKNVQLEGAHAKIISVNEELKKVNAMLEHKVEERTKDLKSALEKLTITNEELDTFIYRASHDLKGPTASLLGLAMLGKTISKDNSYIDFFDRIENTSQNMNNILGKLLTMHTILQTTVKYTPIHLESLLNQIKKLLKLPIDNYQLLNLSDSSFSFYSDQTLLTIIIKNLIENALVFNSNKDDIIVKINAHIEKNKLYISVEDNGDGIEESIRDYIFNLFYRGSQKSLGNGLGLYLVRKATEKLNGEIELQSEVGVFSKFTVILPNKQLDLT